MKDIHTAFPVGSTWEYTNNNRPLIIFRLEQLFASGNAESVWTTDLFGTPDPLHPEVNVISTETDADEHSADVVGTVIGHHHWHGITDVILEIKAPLVREYWTRRPILIQLHVPPQQLLDDWARFT